MIALFVYSVASFGLAYILGHSRISLPTREFLAAPGRNYFARWLLALIECPACLGYWVGLVCGLLAWVLALDLFAYGLSPGWWVPILALYTAGINFILGRLFGLISLEEPPNA